MITPKADLLRQTTRRTVIDGAVNAPPITDALTVAFAQFCIDLPNDPPGVSDILRQGAKRFIDTFQNIASETKPAEAVRPATLDRPQ